MLRRMEDGRRAVWLAAIALLVLSIPAFLPLATEGVPRAFDSVVHLLRIGRLADGVAAGFLLPRWTPELQLGLGYPVFSYYAPAAYYVVALLHWLGLSLYHAFLTTFVGMGLLGAAGMLFWARDVFARASSVRHEAYGAESTHGPRVDAVGPPQPRFASLLPAFLAGVAYLYSPYLLTNIYTRGAIAEVGALALLPWIFWSTRRLLADATPGRYILPLALSLGGLALTHNITLLFAPPVLVGYIGVLLFAAEERRRRTGWVVLGLALAMAVSAFFWLPLILERGYLSDYAYTIAKTIWLPRSVWTWQNVLDTGIFDYTSARPVRIGLVQVLLAAGGFILARRRDGEWLFLGAVALAMTLFGGAWALPLWQSNDILPIAQFPWRMLSIISLLLSLFTGAIAEHPRRVWPAAVVTAGVAAVVIWAHMPRLNAPDVFAPAAVDVAAPVAVQIEADAQLDEGALGNSLMHEYRPRWADRVLRYAPAPGDAALPLDVTPLRASLWDLELRVASDAGGPLRLHTYYFPGWRVTVDGRPLTTYPSTNLGLLTVDVPPGMHDLTVRWSGTRLQQVAAWLSLAALLGLAWVVWKTGHRRWLAGLPIVLATFALCGLLRTPTPAAVDSPRAEVHTAAIELRGLRTAPADDGRLHVYPFWYVTGTPAPELVANWTLGQNGQVVAAYAAQPIFNAVSPANWPPGTLVDDAYRLPLPADLPPGRYDLALSLTVDDTTLVQERIVGDVTIDQAVRTNERPVPDHVVGAQFGDAVSLLGYGLSARRAREEALPDGIPVFPAGVYLETTLQWLATQRVDENYHTFIHLVDYVGRPIAQEDHLPGPSFRPPALWSAYQREPDIFLLRVPGDTTGGLYWPAVGMYDFLSQDRLKVTSPDSDAIVDALRLAPVKIVGATKLEPEVTVAAEFPGLAQMRGYTIEPAQAAVAPGETIAVTLFFQATTTGTADVTRFLQLYNPNLGMAAQHDGIPAGGLNPTWSWIEDEHIEDRVVLTVAADAAPGTYTLYTGLYDPGDGNRVPVLGQDGAPLPDNWLPLATVTVR